MNQISSSPQPPKGFSELNDARQRIAGTPVTTPTAPVPMNQISSSPQPPKGFSELNDAKRISAGVSSTPTPQKPTAKATSLFSRPPPNSIVKVVAKYNNLLGKNPYFNKRATATTRNKILSALNNGAKKEEEQIAADNSNTKRKADRLRAALPKEHRQFVKTKTGLDGRLENEITGPAADFLALRSNLQNGGARQTRRLNTKKRRATRKG
jgi:hypothetical protein